MELIVAFGWSRKLGSNSSASMRRNKYVRYLASVGSMAAACFGLLSCSFAEIHTEPQVDQNLLEPLSLVFHDRISRHVKDGAICVGLNMANEDVEEGRRRLHDAPPTLISELSKTSPNVLPYSRCLRLKPNVERYLYYLEDYKWQENGDLIVSVAFRDGLDGFYGDGLIYRVHKVDGKWEVLETKLEWIA